MDKQIKQILQLQEQGINRKKITTMVGGKAIFNKTLNRNNYIINSEGKIVERTTGDNTSGDTKCTNENDTSSITPIETIEPQQIQPVKEQVYEPVPSGISQVLSNEIDTILDMIKWYKNYKKTTTGDILIELPVSDNAMTSCRANKVVWEQFGEFAKANKSFSKGDLMSQALLEFMNKYR